MGREQLRPRQGPALFPMRWGRSGSWGHSMPRPPPDPWQVEVDALGARASRKLIRKAAQGWPDGRHLWASWALRTLQIVPLNRTCARLKHEWLLLFDTQPLSTLENHSSSQGCAIFRTLPNDPTPYLALLSAQLQHAAWETISENAARTRRSPSNAHAASSGHAPHRATRATHRTSSSQPRRDVTVRM